MGNSFSTTASSSPTTTDPTILEASRDPERVRTDEGTVKERSIEEKIKADQYSKAGDVTAPPYGMLISKTRTGGTVN